MINIEYPWFFALIILPFLVYLLLPRAKKDKQLALKTPFFEELESQIDNAGTRNFKKANYLKYLLGLIWILLIISGSGIQWLGKPVSLPQSGRDLIMAIDLSGSMAIQDMKKANGQMESRFDLVMRVANQFLDTRKGDRVGLILFGTRAYLQTPLTFDIATVKKMLDDASIALPGPQTAIGDAIGLAVKKLKKFPGDSKALILLTDGENNSGTLQPLQAAEIAKQYHIKIYTIGLGGGQMIVETTFGQRLVNTSEDLDTTVLEKIATMTGGKYFRAQNSSDLKKVYESIDKLEPIESDKTVVRPVTYLYPWSLGLALILSFIMAIIWLKRRRGY
ncbi:vWA domain-containing protein [Francisella tularensis]|uniref:vWA domain-containing protein n=1 Tax=Francisella tularensis TaxID=263 RepID=UPI0001855351|nr:VWA domain-containing protein [Francisella tularensis]EDZ89844.1 von Willebrand factor type A domain protein [Francisella tularensis subsp. novicida FTG]MBK2334868.1 VWA domain-containing protein [Francisella tularensis subsp. novicida]